MSQTTNGTMIIHALKFEVIKSFQNRSKRWAAYTVRHVLESFKHKYPGNTWIELEKPAGVTFGRMIYTIEISHEDREQLIRLRGALESDLKRHAHKDVAYKITYRKIIEYSLDSADSKHMTGRDFQAALVGADGC